jgi:uncharacterized protein YkwD
VAAGYPHGAGENLASSWAGHPNVSPLRSVAAVMDAWMNSPGHRENLLRPEYLVVGVGLAWRIDDERVKETQYWVQKFGRFDEC